MIWLLKVNEVFWEQEPEVNEYYRFDTDDVNFDICQYDISLYFASSSYYLFNDSNGCIYWLRFVGHNLNPSRIATWNESKINGVIIAFIKSKRREEGIDHFLDEGKM